MKISACIVTNMKVDLTLALRSLLTQFDEIIIVGNSFASLAEQTLFHRWETQYKCQKIKVLYSEKQQQSYKRLLAAQSTASDVIYFIDDDAQADEHAFKQICAVFENNNRAGLVTGPSLLPGNASFWQRTAQLAVANNPKSGTRYFRHAFEDDVNSSWVIGCNMAVRRSVFKGFNPDILPSYGEEWALAEHVKMQGYIITYNPNQIVYHAPHSFIPHSRQVYRWGKTSRITGSERFDVAVAFYPVAQAWFGLLWCMGRFISFCSHKLWHR